MIEANMGQKSKEWSFYCYDISDYSEDWFFNREFICGTDTNTIFKKMSGLSSGVRISLETVIWNRDHFKIKLINKNNNEPFAIVIKKYREDEIDLYT
ncbi:MAG: hypothetical protein JW827_11300, partial [Spirochaetes bacterium]|nr:hypothetical protein [Spirochaetota bacterium]